MSAPDTQLPLNFPQTFLPDRRLLSRLLEFAAKNGSGDKETIGAETGIPTGKSTGKVEPTIYYALGMGLISAAKKQGVWQLAATDLGRTVLREDPYFSERLTLWLLHLLLCRRFGTEIPAVGLADAWFALFAEGRILLGNVIDESTFYRLLIERHGNKGYLKGLSTLVPRMYAERGSFGEAGILTPGADEDGKPAWFRERAPFDRAFFPAYAALLFILWDSLFGADKQAEFAELGRETRLLALLGWDPCQAAEWLEWMASRGLVQLDRHTGSAVLLRLAETEQAVSGLYSELV